MEIVEKNESMEIEHKYDFNLLYDFGRMVVNNHPESRYFFDTEHADQLLAYLESTDMRIGRAISRWFHMEMGIDLTEDEKTKIGSELSNASVATEKFTVKVTFGCDGSADDYYHGSSCYWGGYESSRDYIEYNGGGAVRIYDDESGEIIGRVWFMPYKDDGLDGLVLFNSYGNGEFDHIVSWGPIVSKLYGTKWSKIHYHVETTANFFQNSHNCVFIGDGEVHQNSLYRHHLSEPDEWVYSGLRICDCCGRGWYDDDITYSEYNDQYICDYCLHRNYVYVEEISDYALTEDCVEVYIPGNRYHNWQWFLIGSDDITEINGTWYHIDNCIVDYYGNLYAPDDTESWFTCAHDNEIYPIFEGILCPNGNMIHEKHYFGVVA